MIGRTIQVYVYLAVLAIVLDFGSPSSLTHQLNAVLQRPSFMERWPPHLDSNNSSQFLRRLKTHILLLCRLWYWGVAAQFAPEHFENGVEVVLEHQQLR